MRGQKQQLALGLLANGPFKLLRKGSLAPIGSPSRRLRSTCARLCHQPGGELDQIQFSLGHVSIQTEGSETSDPQSLSSV
jgi:hypothetical protein